MALTEKQERYCQLAALGTYADAYRVAYSSSAANPSEEARRLNRNPEIFRRIMEIQAANFKPIEDARAFLLEWWWHRMVYDPAEISAWVRGACRYCHGDGHEYQWRLHEFMKELADAERADAPMPDIAGGFGYNSTAAPVDDCPECHGKGKGKADFADTGDLSPAARAAFEGVKQTKDGIEIKMADKQKAAESFMKLSGLDVVQVRNMTEAIPDDEELARLRNDPDAAARVYAALIAGGSGRPTTH